MSETDRTLHTIALIGGTGPEGKGLATRFAIAGHKVIIGSRDPARGMEAADDLTQTLNAISDIDITGDTNDNAVSAADVVVITVPYGGHQATLKGLKTLLTDKIVIDAVVPVYFEKGPRPIEVPAGSATEEAAAILPNSKVAGAFHNLSAEVLLDPTADLNADVLVTGSGIAKEIAIQLASEIKGARAVDSGPLRYSRFIEGITILLIGINSRYKTHTGVIVSGLE
ncbi:MAG TPA: NADPH-dependent F420 reductase [Dehalococcoidia bacterium]|jgi:NADPH-dependent F420 reductase|nr:NADPH-dependent F420 reductase [Dehalococcoidia bacterium]